MDFVNPALLWGASLAAVPIILHLLLRQKPRSLEFPALRLVARRREANRRKLRWRHWLLLLLRVAALCLLALALARPSISSSGAIANQEAPVAAVLVFDTSPRMQYRHQNQTRLEAAQDIARWLLSQLPAESQIGVIESSLGSAVFQVDLAAAVARVDRLKTTWAPQSFTAEIEAACELLSKSELARKELYLFTDLAREQFSGEASARLGELLAKVPDAGIYVVDVGIEKPTNLALGELKPSHQVITRGATLTLDTQLACQGPDGNRTIELYAGSGEPEKRDQVSVQVAQGRLIPIRFSIAGLQEGLYQGHVRLVGEDGLSCDDVRYFTVEVQRPWQVLLVAAAPADEEAMFVAEALAPAAFRTNGRARFACDVVDWAHLDPARLAQYSAVCLLDPPPQMPATWNQLREYVAGGGGLAVCLGGRAVPVESFNAADAQEILPGHLLRQARFPDGDQYVAPTNLAHPSLGKFRGLDPGPPWDLLPVYRFWQLGELAAGSSVVVPYRDGEPALIERPVGRGRVLTLTTSIAYQPEGERWNLLPELESWPFVVLTNEMFLYLVGATDDRLQYEPLQTAVVRPPGARRWSNFILATPDGQRTRREADAAQSSIAITETEQPGQYRLEAGGSEDGWRRGFSVNVPLAQSDLTRATPEEIKTLFGDRDYRVARGRDEINRTIAAGRVGRELYGWLIGLLIAVMALEHWIANRFYREPAGDPSAPMPIAATT